MASGTDAARGHRACPHCGGDFRLSTAESSKYLLCTECGLVRMLPFAALNPHSALLDTFPHPTAV
jgi:phage terminase large subunit GpA-like protein